MVASHKLNLNALNPEFYYFALHLFKIHEDEELKNVIADTFRKRIIDLMDLVSVKLYEFEELERECTMD
jgi:hypothetical protein